MGTSSLLWSYCSCTFNSSSSGDFCLDYTVEYLAECFHLDETDFSLYWKERPANHFKSKRAHSRFNTLFAGKRAGMIHEAFGLKYIKIKFHNKTLLAHRVIWALYHNQVPKFAIDHKDGDGLNNHPSNLRLCFDGADFNNSRNRRRSSNNTSGRTGVYWRKARSRWIAIGRIYEKDGTFNNTYIGSFVEFKDAVAARERWEKENGFTYRE